MQFLVSAVDESTREPIPSFSLQMDPQDNQSGGEVSGSGVLRASLSGGRYAMLVSAKGYLTEVLEGIEIPGKATGGGYSTYPINDVDTFVGTTIGLRISLRKIDPTINRKTRRRPFLSDTVFYEITSPTPEIVGGSGSLMNRIRRGASSIVYGGDKVVLAKSWFTAYIDKGGRVVRVDVENKGRHDVDQLITRALYETKFSPGQILGKPVNSKIMIPFEFTLRGQKK
ncbi:MAG TPA: hypothetical protein VMH23_00645 [Bacteroidota bacterium]|nr:hypothetical protein [Bacteroidota bacterium]